jgi:2-C-methyl-D-erythritol 4-phosphate cytidylyltransferase
VEAAGHPVRVFWGSYDNLKVTTPEDLVMVDQIIGASAV